MRHSNVLIAFASAVIGGLAVAFVLVPAIGSFSLGKSDRLSGEQTETAFLPERFGVPSSQQ
jgi:hypothetical protein